MFHLQPAYMTALLIASCMTSAAGEAQAADALCWRGTVYDFGVIKEDDGAVAHRFVFENASSETVSIVSAGARCNCTGTWYDTRTIAAGDTASVTVRFDPTLRPGEFNQRVVVRTTASSTPYYLFVKGEVTPSLRRLAREFPYGKRSLRFATDTIAIAQTTGIYTFSLPAVNIGKDDLTPDFGALPAGVTASTTLQRVPCGARVSFVFECDINALRAVDAARRTITIYDGARKSRVAAVIPIILTNK